ncbi:MAG: hypothetical protein ACLU6Y_01595 [Ruminococcus sp.]
MVFDINGEFITEITREWFHTGEKSYETIMEILMDSMTGTDKPEAQIRRYAGGLFCWSRCSEGGARQQGHIILKYTNREKKSRCRRE